MKINQYIKKNWAELPKSKFDEKEMVMIKEVSKDNGGWGHHSYEGYGVDEKGNYRWMFSSGCSCNGGPSENDTIKDFIVDGVDLSEIDPKSVNFEALKVEYTTY